MNPLDFFKGDIGPHYNLIILRPDTTKLVFTPNYLGTAGAARLYCRYVPDGNTGTTTATGTAPHIAANGCSQWCRTTSQALYRATHTIGGHFVQ